MKDCSTKKTKLIFLLLIAFCSAVLYAQNSVEDQLSESDEALEVFDLKPRSLEYSSESNGLVSMEFEGELFVPHRTSAGLEIVHSSNTDVTRFFYDNLLRITKKEVWQIRNAENYNAVRSVIYEYNAENFYPSKITNIENEFKDISLYDNSKNLLERKKYVTFKEKEFLILQEKYLYDEENRIINSIIQENNYSEDYKKISYKFLKEYRYSYNDFGQNLEYYENSVLKNQIKYTGENEYYSQVYFDGGISISSFFRDSKKVYDKYIQNSKVIREVKYE
ncbi:MAG: hypothetical protein K6A89_05350 [Treponema sp.]|nr:hypothetical protein [Treponema sp.]